MKNEKRDVTLNEEDSIKDMLCMERVLLNEYVTAIYGAERKEARTALIEGLSATAEEVFFLEDLLATVKSKR